MTSQVKLEPPDADSGDVFGMNDHSPFLHTEGQDESVDPWMNDLKMEDDDPFGLYHTLGDEYKMEDEEEYDMKMNGDMVHDQSDDLMLIDDGEAMRARIEADTNFTAPLEATLPISDKDAVQDKNVYKVNARLPRGNYIPYDDCTLFGNAVATKTTPDPNGEPPIDNVIEKEPPGNLYDAIKKKTRRQSARILEGQMNTVVEKKKRKSTVTKKVAGARKSTPRNAKKTVSAEQDVTVAAKRGRRKGAKNTTKEVSNPLPALSPMDNGDLPMTGNGIIDSALVRRRARLVGGTGKAAGAATAAAHSNESQSSLLPWNGSVNSVSAFHPFHQHSFQYSPIDRSHSTATVSRSAPNIQHQSYTGGLTAINHWGVHSTTVSHSAPNVINPIADHTYTVWPCPPIAKKQAAAKVAKATPRLIDGPPKSLAADPAQQQMVRLKPPANSSMDIPTASGEARLADPRLRRDEGEMRRAKEPQKQMETPTALYDPRRVQRKSIDSDFVPHPLDEGEMFRVVCGPIPDKDVSLDVIRERVLNLCHPTDYKFTRFEGSVYMWLRFTIEQEAYDLIKSKPIRLGLFSTSFNRPGTIIVDMNGPMGDYYLFTVLTKYGSVAGVEKIGEFKWKATFLEEVEAATVVNQGWEVIGQASLIYSSYTPVESPASPPYQSEDTVLPSSVTAPAQLALPIRRAPIPIPTEDHHYVYDQLPAGTDAQSYSATMADTPASPTGYDATGTMVVPHSRPTVQTDRPKGAMVPRTVAGTMAAQQPHSGYRVQPYEGHMAHLVPAPGVRVPATTTGGRMVMVRSMVENAIEKVGRRGEGLAAFPVVDEDDVKECVVGMRAWTNHILLGPMPAVYLEDEMRRAYQIHSEIGLRMVGDFMHLFIAQDASHEAKLHLWRIQNENCAGGVMTNIAKGVPRSIIVQSSSIYSTAEIVKQFFESQFGTVVSVNEQHERSAKIFAVNFMHRKEAASAFNTRIHFAYVNGEPFVLCEVVRD